MFDVLPPFYNLSYNVFGDPTRITYNDHNATAIFKDLLAHTPGGQHLTPDLPMGLLRDLLHAQLPIMGAHLAAQHLRHLTAFRRQHPAYTVFQDPRFLGSSQRVEEVRNMFTVSKYMEADHIALDALKNFCNPNTPREREAHQKIYRLFVDKMANYIPYFALRPVLAFANLQQVFTNPDERSLEYLLRALTPYYLTRNVDMTKYAPDAWVDTYLSHNAPERWRNMLATPLSFP